MRVPFPSLDLSNLDARRLADFTVIDDRVVDLARDAAYVTIGFSVLAVQRAQVRRRELERAVRKLTQAK